MASTMLRTAFFIAVVMVLGHWPMQTASTMLPEAAIAEKHQQWMERYGRSYLDSIEKDLRMKIFKENMEFIENFNSQGNRTFKLGLNEFSDLSNEEFKARYTGYKMPANSDSTRTTSFRHEAVALADIPTNKDWTAEGAVNSIKHQQLCGCCWAFSSVAVVEAITQIKTGQLPSLSEQQLVDCVEGNNGCGGGWMDTAFQYIIDNQGIASENDYPYQAMQGSCQASSAATAATISGFEDVPANNEEALLKAVSQQPVSIAINADYFKDYRGGLFTGECGNTLNHAVVLVGYGTSEDGTDYWLIRNSWGEAWGENGYMRIQRNSGVSGGVCGLAMKPSYPVV